MERMGELKTGDWKTRERIGYGKPIKPVCMSVGLSVRKVYYGKTADWIRMPFGSEWGRTRDECIRWGS